jgi:sugar (pentulose or hexulose) kinase
VAMLAGLGAGIYRDVDDAIRRCVRLDTPIEPDPAAHAHYDERIGEWQQLAASNAVRRQA